MMGWVGYVARVGEKRTHIYYWSESQKERDHLEDQDISRWIILNGSGRDKMGISRWIILKWTYL
jgi:hypothetical protein